MIEPLPARMYRTRAGDEPDEPAFTMRRGYCDRRKTDVANATATPQQGATLETPLSSQEQGA